MSPRFIKVVVAIVAVSILGMGALNTVAVLNSSGAASQAQQANVNAADAKFRTRLLARYGHLRCVDSNRRNAATVRQLQRERRSPANRQLERDLYLFFLHHHAPRLARAFVASERSSTTGTIALINALSPHRRCLTAPLSSVKRHGG